MANLKNILKSGSLEIRVSNKTIESSKILSSNKKHRSYVLKDFHVAPSSKSNLEYLQQISENIFFVYLENEDYVEKNRERRVAHTIAEQRRRDSIKVLFYFS